MPRSVQYIGTAARGIAFWDAEAVISTGAQPNRYAGGMSSDSLHPNDTAIALLAPSFQNVLSTVINGMA